MSSAPAEDEQTQADSGFRSTMPLGSTLPQPPTGDMADDAVQVLGSVRAISEPAAAAAAGAAVATSDHAPVDLTGEDDEEEEEAVVIPSSQPLSQTPASQASAGVQRQSSPGRRSNSTTAVPMEIDGTSDLAAAATPAHSTAPTPAAPAAGPLSISTASASAGDTPMVDAEAAPQTPARPPTEYDEETGHPVYEVERIVGHKGSGRGLKYCVEWKGYSEAEATWQDRKSLVGAMDLLETYERENHLIAGGQAPVKSKSAVKREEESAAVVEPTGYSGMAEVDVDIVRRFLDGRLTVGVDEVLGIGEAEVEVLQRFLNDVLMPGLEDASKLVLAAPAAKGAPPAVITSNEVKQLIESIAQCKIALNILSMPDVPRPLIREEYFASIIHFLRSTIRSLLLPLYDYGAREKLTASLGLQAGGEVAAVDWTSLEGKLRNLVHKMGHLLDNVSKLLVREQVPELLTTQLLDISYAVLTIQQISGEADMSSLLHSLQSACAHLIQTIFLLSDSGSRRSILDALIHAYRELAPTRKHLRSYVVQAGGKKNTGAAANAVKKEGGAAASAAMNGTGTSSNEDLAAALGSSIPLPSASLATIEADHTVAVQLLTALVCHLLQSISTEPLRSSAHRDGGGRSLLDRIKAEVHVKEVAALAAAQENKAAEAPGSGSGSGKRGGKGRKGSVGGADDSTEAPAASGSKGSGRSAAAGKKAAGSKKKKGGKDSSEAEEESKADDDVVLLSSLDVESALLPTRNVLNSNLDTPEVRAEFIDTVTQPVGRVQEYLAFFLRAFIERIQPPIHATANSSMTSKLSRQLLKNFIEDLLQLLYAPEFPIAEQLLFALTSFMVNLVDPAVKASTTSQVSDRFKMSCVGMLALIAIHLKRHAALAAENPMKIRPKVELVDPTESEDGSGSHLAAVARGPEVLHCVCGVHREYASLELMEQDESIGMTVDCDECHVFYHSRCIGLREREIAELTGWHCENCILRMECARQTKELMHKREKLNALAASATASESGSSSSKKKKARSSSLTSAHAALTTASSLLSELESELPSLDSHESAKVGSAVLRQLLMNYLDKEIVGSGEETMLFARQYILCSWMHQAKMADDQRRAVEARNAEKAGATPAAAAISSALSTTVSPSFERDLSLVQLNFEPARSSATAKLDIASSAAASSHAGSLLPPEMAGAQRKWINREMIVRIGRQLSAEKPMSLQHLPVRILVALCNRCSDPSPKFRSCAVSAVADLVRVDPIVLKEPRVKGTLMKRLTDSSISTREAVVDLIGTHILQAQQEQAKQERQSQQQQQAMVKQENGTKGAPASSASAAAASPSAALSSKYSLDADYFTFVLKSLADPGISVRKKVVRVMRDLCLQQGKLHPRIVDMVERVISCVRDSEESMQSLAVTIVYEMWFDRGSERIKERVATSSGGGSKVTKDEPQIYLQDAPHLLASSPFTPAFQQQVQLIVAVIHRLSQTVGGVSMTDGVESLTDILLLLLEQESSLAKNTSAGGEMTSLTGLKMNLLKLSREQKKRQQSRASTFQNAINNSDKSSKRSSGAAARAAVDTCSIRAICVDIVKGVIQLLMNTGNAAPAASSSSVAGPLPPLSRLSCLQTLHVFSQVDPSLLLLHIHTLLPYLGLGQPVDVEARRREGRTKEEIDEEVRRYQATVGPDTQCVLLLLEIYREVLYLVDSPMAAANPELADQLYRLKADVAFTQKLKDDVTAILFRTQQPVLVKAAVPTLAMIAQKTNNGELIAKTIKTFVGYLWTHQGHARTPNPNQTRALISVGLLVKHFDIEAFYASSERSSASAAGTVVNGFWQDIWKHCAETWPAFKQTPDLLRRSTWMLEANPKKQANICDQIFNLYRLYLRAASTAGPPAAAAAGPSLTASKESQPAAGGKTIATQAHCLRAIIAMFSRKPTLIPQAKEVIDICLSPNPAAHELQRQALQCLREFLQNEDRRLQRTQREDRMKAKTTRKKSAGAAGGKGKKGAAKQEEDGEGEEDVDIEDEQSESMTDQSTIGSSPGHRKQQASWTDSSIDASDFLPPMVAMCEKHVYQLAMSSSPHVRAEALQFMHVFLSQAVTNPIDAMPSLIAAFTDRQPWVNKCAMTILHELIANKKEYLRFLEQRFADGLKLSYGMQARLVKGFDPLHRTNLNKPSSSSSNASSSSEAAAASAAAAAAEDPSLPPIFDRTPTEGLAAVYTLLKKAIASRKNICKILALDLLAVDQIGIFARQKDLAQTVHQLQTSDAMDVQTIGESPAKAAASLDPPATLGRSLSLNSVGVASPMEPATPTGGSQEGDYPAFVPPLIERASAPRLPPTGLAQSMGMASPATVSSASSGELITQAKETSANPLAFLAYTAGLITGFPFEDDEPLQLCAHLSKVINTHGAALQTQMQQTIIALKKLNGEHVNENDEEEVSQLAQPMETGGTQASAAPTPLPDKASLLQSLALQGESAMAITILIQLRQWLQKSYELAGLFETWSLNALSSSTDGSSSAASSSRAGGGPMKLSKKLEIPLYFHDLPLSENERVVREAMIEAAERAHQPPAAQRKVAGKQAITKPPHARHQSAPMLSSSASTSLIPPLLSAQFSFFSSSMDREAMFLAMKAPARRGHKRAATTGGMSLAGEEESPKRTKKGGAAAAASGGSGSSGTAGGGRKKPAARKKKRKSFGADSDDEDDASEDDDDDAAYDDASYDEQPPSSKPRRVGSGSGGGGGSGRGKRAKKVKREVEVIEEGDEEQAEEEEERAAEAEEEADEEAE